jgi:antitoxin component YwqK of YwqJK toxin-antitoxin module
MNLITSRLLLIAVLSSLTISSFSQSDTLFYFFDKSGKSCKSKNAAYVGFGIKEDGQIRFANYIVPEGLPVMEGRFTDSTLEIKNGHFKSYDPPGYLTEEGAYKKNSKEGYWIRWNKNGQVEDSEFYQHGNLLLSIKSWYNDYGVRTGRLAKNDVQGKKEQTNWYDNGNLKLASTTIQEEGESAHYDEDGALTSVDTYEKGQITASKYYKKDGTQLTDEEVALMKKDAQAKLDEQLRQIEREAFNKPTFPGGQDAFWGYVNENIRIPSSVFDHLPDRTVRVSFMLNKNGQAEDIQFVDNGSSDIRRTFVDVLNKMPRWDMKGHQSYGPLKYIFNLKGTLTHF